VKQARLQAERNRDDTDQPAHFWRFHLHRAHNDTNQKSGNEKTTDESRATACAPRWASLLDKVQPNDSLLARRKLSQLRQVLV
jgi:hypothetical protein